MNSKIKIGVSVALLVGAALAGWMATRYYFSLKESAKHPLVEVKEGLPQLSEMPADSGESVFPVKIFYPSGDGVAAEERKIKGNPLPVKMAEAIMQEYVKGLKEDIRDTKVLGVYRDRSNILYVDLSDSFRKNFSGDARQEYYLMKSLFETLVTNVPGTEDVKLLIEGKEIESIGGHFSSLYPLKDTVSN